MLENWQTNFYVRLTGDIDDIGDIELYILNKSMQKIKYRYINCYNNNNATLIESVDNQLV